MEKTKAYPKARFSAEVLNEAIHFVWKLIGQPKKISQLQVSLDGESWNHDDLDEFLADYRKIQAEEFTLDIISENYRLRVYGSLRGTTVHVSAPNRSEIEKISYIFESNYEKSIIKVKPEETDGPVIFVGHGRSEQWRDLKDHLHEKHGYRVVTYETGARAGHTIRDILDEMASQASFACLVLTAEDKQDDGTFHARQNVIHETGLFQGRLGFSRAIVLLEERVEPFSNLQGIDQIRYSKIKETFGEVLATIRREFDDITSSE